MPQSSEQAEKALKERQRLYARYKRAKHQHRRELYAAHPRLREFALQLQRYSAADAVPFLRFVREENHGWLCTAPPEVRAEALQLCDERIIRIRGKAGLLPLDDPIPTFGSPGEEEDSVWLLCRAELA